MAVLFGAPDEEPIQGGVRARPAAAEHRLLEGQLQVQRRHPAQVRPLGGAHGAVPRQEVRTLYLQTGLYYRISPPLGISILAANSSLCLSSVSSCML